MKKQQHHKIISTILILAFAIGVLTCGEEDSGDLGLMWIPAGTFWMGRPDGVNDRDDEGNLLPLDSGSTSSDERPVHKVTITKGFYMSRYSITQSQYYLVTGEEPSEFINVDGDGRGRRPVERVNWYDAIVFCNKLSIKHGLQPVYSISGSTNPDEWIAANGGEIPNGSANAAWDAVDPNWNANGYRLPTEAEWEYACRAGTTTAYNTGNTISDDTGWYDDNTPPNPNTGLKSTQEVGLKPPNAWGLYDMHGNVWEWCWDWYEDNYYTKPEASDNPKGPISIPSVTPQRVHRGGSWLNPMSSSYLRSAYRAKGFSSNRVNCMGFRVVRP